MVKLRLPVYTASEAAQEIGVTPAAVYSWLNDGTLQEVTTIRGSVRLADAESVLTLKRARELGKAGAAPQQQN